MALDVTVGGVNTQSFATVAQCKAFLPTQPFWTAADTAALGLLSDDQIGSGLNWAFMAMNDLAWRGQKAFGNQAGCWPRVGIGLMYQMDYDQLDEFHRRETTMIPDNVWKGQCLIWWLVIRRGLVSLKPVSEGTEKAPVTSVSLAGLVTVQFSNTGQTQQGSSLSQIIRSPEFPIFLFLKPYLTRIRFRGHRGRRYRYQSIITPTVLSNTEAFLFQTGDHGDIVTGNTDVEPGD